MPSDVDLMRTRTLPAGKLKTIIVNRHHISSNKKNSGNLPVFSVKCGKETVRGHKAVIHGTSSFEYNPENPLNCGATAWNRTRAEVQVIDIEENIVEPSQWTLDSYSNRQ